MAAIKRIKKSITEKEYMLLMNYTRGDESLKSFNKERFLRIFSLLYYSGMRINELSQIKNKQLNQIFKTGEAIIISHKTDVERILYFSPKAIKEFEKYFDATPTEDYVICAWGNPKNKLHEISLIKLVNGYMKKILDEGFTSHSFRQGLLTEMGSKSINPKIIQAFVGHSDVRTTLEYIKPTENDVRQALVR